MKPLLLDEIKFAVHGELKTPSAKGMVTAVTTDSRNVPKESLFVALRGERFDGHDYIDTAVASGAKAILIDRSLPLTKTLIEHNTCVMQVDDTEKALGLLARFYRRSLGRRVTVIGLTGSAGKTTTREMIYHTLSSKFKGCRSPKNFNNSIGVPLTLLGIEPDHEFVVVEIGTNAPGEVASLARIAEPDIGLITHVGPSHLEKLIDIDGVSVEKISIIAGLTDHGVLICPTDHKPTFDRVKALGRPFITFGIDDNADVRALNITRSRSGMNFATNDHVDTHLPIGGLHNVKNALAALAVARRMGLTSAQFAAAMKDFKPPHQRMNYLDFNGITVIDDTYNANPSSMAAAIDELTSHAAASRRVLIVGDMCELGAASETEHQKLGRTIAAANIDLLLTVGPNAAITANAALEAGMGRGSVQKAINSRRLARLVKSLILHNDLILVKGSRAMAMEKVVDSLSRYRPPKDKVIKTAPIKSLKTKTTTKHKLTQRK